jgi:membrane fusion protein, heavy metal efflux system
MQTEFEQGQPAMADTTTNTRSFLASGTSKVLSGLVLVAVVAGGWLGVQDLNSKSAAETDSETERAVATAESELTLPAAKIAQARFTTEPSNIRRIDEVRTVSGRLTYDDARHVEVKAAVSGVLFDVLVKPGDVVTKGQLLAVVNSPEIGRARATVLSEQSKYQVTVQQVERHEEVTTNLRSLFSFLDEDTPLDDIEEQFNDTALGTYRQEIMSSYSERCLARQLETAARPLAESGSLSMRTLRERENDRHIADAKFRSVRETTAFDIGIREQQLAAEQRDAQNQLMIARNNLATLLGFENTSTADATSASLSRMDIRAPFAGTIESRFFAGQERVQPSDRLFILANTESLYVSADIRENDWAVMSLHAGQEITVVAPAILGRTFVAKIHYIGREVDVDSNSLPLVATIGNHDGQLRPGMFVRVSIPVARSRDVVAVRPESVLQHENEKFVFVSVNDRTFRRVDVQTGVNNEQWVAITDGLDAGENVVTGGAFLLKSELLLAGEDE